MHPNAQLLTRLYEAIGRHDAAAAASCYHHEAHFNDGVFDLHGPGPGDMWRMFFESGSDLRVEFSGVEADDEKGKIHWECWYTFSATGRKVHNVIDGTYTFRDGKILEHTDRFDFKRWAKQALGLPGTLFGGTAFLKRFISKKAMGNLDAFLRKESESASKPAAPTAPT